MSYCHEWMKNEPAKEYLAYDVTSISSYGHGMENLEWGYNRDKECAFTDAEQTAGVYGHKQVYFPENSAGAGQSKNDLCGRQARWMSTAEFSYETAARDPGVSGSSR